MRPRFLAVALLGLVWAGCSATPQRFERGQKIPLGAYSLAVTRTELIELKGELAVLAYFRCDETGNREEAEKFQLRFLGAFRLQDSSGRKHMGVPLPAQSVQYARMGAGGAIDSGQMQDLFDSLGTGGDAHEWVVIFGSPSDASRLTLIIYNPDTREGQPKAAAVELGR